MLISLYFPFVFVFKTSLPVVEAIQCENTSGDDEELVVGVFTLIHCDRLLSMLSAVVVQSPQRVQLKHM